MDRIISTPSRSSTPTISKRKISIPSSALSNIKSNFDLCLDDIKKRFDYVDLFSSSKSSKEEKEASQDILRYQIVSIDSLLDYYMHQIIIYGFTKMFNDEWAKSQRYSEINISLDKVEYAIENPENTDWIEESIRQQNEKYTLMQSKKIKRGLEQIDLSLNNIVQSMGYNPIDVYQQLDALYSRRTQIVHYADINLATKSKNPIGKSEVVAYINLVEKLCDKIYESVVDKDATS